MKNFAATLAVAAFAFVSVMAFAADEADAPKITCPVSGKPAVAEHTVDYKGGKVQFCCPNCPKAFSADPAKFAVKANHQLALTGQAKQVACPFTGAKLNPEKKADVAGVSVNFCCGNCEAKAKAMSQEDLLAKAFSDAAFDKAYKVGEAKTK
jgi:YHS domain-containing protein